ncbi:MAG: hypothetical protein ACI8UZ_001818, partial [Akkermansiaceae bacterium]
GCEDTDGCHGVKLPEMSHGCQVRDSLMLWTGFILFIGFRSWMTHKRNFD